MSLIGDGLVSVSSLYTKCLHFVCHHLDILCENASNKTIGQQQAKAAKQQKCQFKDKISNFNHIISQDLLEKLNDLGKLNDKTIHLFGNSQTCLKKFKIKNVSLSKESIKMILKQHQLNEIIFNNVSFEPESSSTSSSITSSSVMTMTELVDALNEWSFENLKSLNVARNNDFFYIGATLTNFKKFKHLKALNVSNTSFSNQSLDIVTEYLVKLETLDMSVTRVNDLSSLLRIKDSLKQLIMYNMRNSLNDDIIEIICGLEKLQNLDLSCDVSTKIFAESTLSLFDINLFLDQISNAKLKHLIYLDISGKIPIREETIG